MEKMKIEHFHGQLEDEERAYADIQAELAVELIYKARIHRQCELDQMSDGLEK